MSDLVQWTKLNENLFDSWVDSRGEVDYNDD